MLPFRQGLQTYGCGFSCNRGEKQNKFSQFVEFSGPFFAIPRNAHAFSLSNPTEFSIGIDYAFLTTIIFCVASIDINGTQILGSSE